MWLYQNKVIEKLEDFGENIPYGFIYKIENIETGKFYIGKKQLMSTTNIKMGKKELAELIYNIGLGQSTGSGFGTIYKTENHSLYRLKSLVNLKELSPSFFN